MKNCFNIFLFITISSQLAICQINQKDDFAKYELTDSISIAEIWISNLYYLGNGQYKEPQKNQLIYSIKMYDWTFKSPLYDESYQIRSSYLIQILIDVTMNYLRYTYDKRYPKKNNLFNNAYKLH